MLLGCGLTHGDFVADFRATLGILVVVDRFSTWLAISFHMFTPGMCPIQDSYRPRNFLLLDHDAVMTGLFN
jgi:hypothetical protein